MKSKEILKEGSRRQVNTLTDPTKKVYLTPSEFLWDNYKKGERMKEEIKNSRVWIEDPEEYLENKKLEEHTIAHKMVEALYELKENGKLDARNKKTLLKNINNLAKAIRNINRVLKEVL